MNESHRQIASVHPTSQDVILTFTAFQDSYRTSSSTKPASITIRKQCELDVETIHFVLKTIQNIEIRCVGTKYDLRILNLAVNVVTGPRRDEVTGDWRRLHNEEINDLYSSPNIVRVVKSRRMRWAGHVARMGEER